MEEQLMLMVTGGAGFIGSALIRYLINKTNDQVINVDSITYSGNLENLSQIDKSPRYFFEKENICDEKVMKQILDKYKPTKIIHLAAESHVDRSIDGSAEFIKTNIIGTYNLLECARTYYSSLNEETKKAFRFHHVSTDEVFGDLYGTNDLFTEETPYEPSSPYSATKASSDHLVRAWHRTYGLPVIITNCSNNYGPYQYPEKLIPLVIINALKGNSIPVYGDGSQIRDWLFVDDHVVALLQVLNNGKIGETYNIGGFNEKTNLTVVKSICTILDELKPNQHGKKSYSDLISFVKDRPGHDRRYAIDASKINSQLGWKPVETFETGLTKTVKWYLENEKWISKIQERSFTKRQGNG